MSKDDDKIAGKIDFSKFRVSISSPNLQLEKFYCMYLQENLVNRHS